MVWCMGVTDDRDDYRLGHGVDEVPVPMNDVYLVLSEEMRAGGFVRPVITDYQHEYCGTITTMNQAIAETYAKQPWFYGSTYCVKCAMHRLVGEFGEFVWCSSQHVTWVPGGKMTPHDESVTAQRLKVGT